MQGSTTNRGPASYFGWCHRSNQYRMMDLPDYVSNTQEGMTRMMNNSTAAYQNFMPGYAAAGAGAATMPHRHHQHGKDCGCGCGDEKKRDCGCNDHHCECCVCDADVLVHARCGEIRRIPLTFENDTRRDKPITLELGKLLTQGGKDLGWNAQLTETQFTLRPCDEHTVSLLVAIRCKTDDSTDTPSNPTTPTNVPGKETSPAANATGATRLETGLSAALSAIDDRLGKVDKCVVGYATIRAEGCLTRPIVVAIAVLPEDCDAFRHPCGCSCCH